MPSREHEQSLNVWRAGVLRERGRSTGPEVSHSGGRRLVSGLAAAPAQFGVEAGGEEQAGDEQEAGVKHAGAIGRRQRYHRGAGRLPPNPRRRQLGQRFLVVGVHAGLQAHQPAPRCQHIFRLRVPVQA